MFRIGLVGVKRIEMHKLGDKLVEAGIAKPPRRTTFSDGRMATTEAYLYYKERCRDRGMDFISKMMFKWHLKHGQYLQSELCPNPFGRYPARIYAISMEAILNFVEELAQREDTLTLQRQGNVVRRTTKDRVKGSSPPTPPPEPESKPPASETISPPTEPEPQESMTETSDEAETVVEAPPSAPPASSPPSSNDGTLDSSEAFEYLCKKAGHKQALNRTMFGFYLAYDLIDSVFEGRSRRVDPESLDAFVELFPSGLYKQHIDYVVRDKLEKGDLTMGEAYDYYATLDPNPVTRNSFRSLVAAGIVVAIRAENKPSSPTLGFTKEEIEYFAKLRKRIAENNANVPTTKGFKTKLANGTQRLRRKVTQSDTDSLDSGLQGTQAQGDALVATQAAAIKQRQEAEEGAEASPTEREWISIKEAYRYYAERVDEPHGEKWFAGKCYKGDPFEAVCTKDVRPGNPTGKKYLVNLDSVDTYLESNADTRATNLSFPLDKAYHKFRDIMPAGLSLIQFKRLVRNSVIKSFIRDGVARVRYGDVGSYFQGREELDKAKRIPLSAGYDYYCSKASDPVSSAHFFRWVAEGFIAAGKKISGHWHITMEAIDDFLTDYPSGRKRSNKNSRANQNDAEAAKSKPPESKAKSKAKDKGDGPYVTLSMNKFPTKEGLAAAVEALQTQGIRVEIEP